MLPLLPLLSLLRCLDQCCAELRFIIAAALPFHLPVQARRRRHGAAPRHGRGISHVIEGAGALARDTCQGHAIVGTDAVGSRSRCGSGVGGGA